VSEKKFGTFSGVFTPSILTIIGVIMYLRLGWVVGTVGLGGALVIILLSHVATITTGLSLSSMTTNVRIGAGGFYSLVSRSLGLEAGGAIGIPLYFSQTFSIALYIIGFTEAWVRIFPSHDVRLISTLVLLLLLMLSYIGARVAMRVQYLIMAIVALSLVSFFLGKGEGGHQIILWTRSTEFTFWGVFAIFFPAVTGIAAGAAMSGDLKDPRRSLPWGILSAIGIGLIIYVSVAWWYAKVADPEQLRSNYTIIMDVALWRWVVLAGIMGATLSSALGSLVGAPRVLMALAHDHLVPFNKTLGTRSQKGEPRNAVLITGILVESSLLFGSLDSIASLLTMFFLITYGTINAAVFIEKATGIPSFRPSFNITLAVPLVGALWCGSIMFLINPVFAAVAIVVIPFIYMVQVKRGLRTPWGDVRSALFNAIAEWAAKTSARMPQHAKSWKPHLMIPVEAPAYWTSLITFIRDVIFPGGTLRVFSVQIIKEGVENKISEMVDFLLGRKDVYAPTDNHYTAEELEEQLNQLVAPIRDEGIFTAATVIESHNFLEGISVITQVMKGMFFPPNIMFLTISEEKSKTERLEKMIAVAIREKMGIIMLRHLAKVGFGKKEKVNVWLRDGSPNQDLTILTALQLERNWGSSIRLLTIVERQEDQNKTQLKFRKIAELTRMPKETEISVLVGNFKEALAKAPPSDLNIFGFPKEIGWDTMVGEIADFTNTSCLFVKDSGEESAFA
jgi:solute carrier family 12 (sodium/potassium/chloride transporter), member 2